MTKIEDTPKVVDRHYWSLSTICKELGIATHIEGKYRLEPYEMESVIISTIRARDRADKLLKQKLKELTAKNEELAQQDLFKPEKHWQKCNCGGDRTYVKDVDFESVCDSCGTPHKPV